VVPFASHEKFKGLFNWEDHFKKQFIEIGDFIRKYGIRISMHPDQFVLLNSLKPDVVLRSIDELDYHCRILDCMDLDSTHKIQLHVGGVFGDKPAAMKRFIDQYKLLNDRIKKRLVIENDDRLYSVKDCLEMSSETGIPILFDNLHHECLNNGESLRDSVLMTAKTWKATDGVPMMDYSSQEKGERKGKHAFSIDMKHFAKYFDALKGIRADVILEIKDKETSVLKAITHLKNLQK